MGPAGHLIPPQRHCVHDTYILQLKQSSASMLSSGGRRCVLPATPCWHLHSTSARPNSMVAAAAQAMCWARARARQPAAGGKALSSIFNVYTHIYPSGSMVLSCQPHCSTGPCLLYCCPSSPLLPCPLLRRHRSLQYCKRAKARTKGQGRVRGRRRCGRIAGAGR